MFSRIIHTQTGNHVREVDLGEVAERSKAATRNGCYTVKRRIGGSNPSPLRQSCGLAGRSNP
jgi:hypothetical protein